MFVVPALHPAFILRQNARLAGTVEHALTRAMKAAYQNWRPKWSEDEFDLKPTADSIVKGLRAMAGKRVAFDVETDGQHPLECQLRCIGFYDGTHGVIVPLLYRDGEREDVPVVDRKTGEVTIENHAAWKPYFEGAELAKVLAAVSDLLVGAPVEYVEPKTAAKALKAPAKKAKKLTKTAKKATKLAATDGDGAVALAPFQLPPSSTRAALVYTQNGQYDRQVLRQALGLDVPAGGTGFTFDTIVAHHVIASYLPHKLGFLAALYTEAPYYKANEDGEAWSAGTDIELWRYCLRDVKATWLAAEQMQAELKEVYPNAELVFEQDTWQEDACEQWKRVGIQLDRPTLRYYRWHYGSVRDRALAAMRELLKEVGLNSEDSNFTALLEKLAGKADDEQLDEQGRIVEVFNPASLIELRMMLAGLKIPLTEVTATGQLSTAKEILTGARKALLAQRVSPGDPRIAFLDYLFAWRESAKVVGTYLYPEILRDGRVHPNFNVHVVPTGRLSSSGPNFQNQPAEIRGMFVARDEHVIVSMDWDALEMRLGAFMSGDPVFIEVFRKYDTKTGPKPHIANMAAIFGLPATAEAADANPGMYRAAKVFAYAVAYGAGEDTVFEQVREELPDMDWESFKTAFTNYKKTYPVLFKFQQDVVKQGTRFGFIDSMLLGRRMWFFERTWGESSPEATAMQNAPYQSTGSDVVGAANRRIMNELVLPWRRTKLLKRGDKWKDKDGVTHVVFADEVIEQLAQVHDELVFEVPKRLKDEFCAECKRLAEQKPTKLEVQKDGSVKRTVLDWNLPVDIKAKRRWKPVQARCGAVVKGKDDVVTKCRELVDIELLDGKPDAGFDRWEGACKCGSVKRIDVPHSVAA